MNNTVNTEPMHLEPFRAYNLFEQHRVETFKDWPFAANSSCSIAKMAEAGFYWTGNERENDTATCFVCSKTLDGWESDDHPWQEHRKHAPQCEFVRLGCAEKDLTLLQFMEIFRIVIKGKIEKKSKEYKVNFTKQCESMLDDFRRSAK